MQKLEDEYNKSLANSKIRIDDTIKKMLSIFSDPKMLGFIVSSSVKTLKKDRLRKVSEPSEENNLKKLQKRNSEKSGPLPPPELRNHTSFLQQNYINKTIPSVKIYVSESA